MKEKFVMLYADIAKRVSELSRARRLKVGAVIVKDDRILSYGYNGMPKGFDNDCETDDYVTKPEVIHAEINAIAKVAASSDSTKNSSIFITHAPCSECAKMIIASGIETVYYLNSYRDETGINMLKLANLDVLQLEMP
jgi:dCMP deaminase